ncbi:hypothetical protein OG235_07485 [Streptomyces sp. NBC_00024]|uniref:hypothetical protein n=1 Tax=Streptomyces sp. NBC_00024 TaxID=2903612 RepID=UPI003255D2F0
MRAYHLCAALGLPTDKSKVEGFRSKLKWLVERRIATPGDNADGEEVQQWGPPVAGRLWVT